VFRQFSDMEALFIRADQVLIDRLTAREKILPSGTLEQRIQTLCKYLNEVYEEFSPYLQMTLVQIWRYKILRKNYRNVADNLKKQVIQFFPELKEKPRHTQLAVVNNLAFEMWNRYRSMDKLDKSEIEESMIATVTCLLK